MNSVGEGEAGMICENSIETSTLLYVKQMTSASVTHEAECPKGQPRVMGWGGRGKEGSGWAYTYTCTHVYLWLIHVDAWQKPWQYCKVIILWLKLIRE